MKKILLFLSLTLAFLSLPAQTTRQEIDNDPFLSGGNMKIYQAPEDIKYTPAPKGYKPVYISAFARHGSRYHWRSRGYSDPFKALMEADENEMLTDTGREVYSLVRAYYEKSNDRIGELVPLGAEQHREIAQRMIQNFPELFSGKVYINAVSTNVMRTALSMMNECWVIEGHNPKTVLTAAASTSFNYLNNQPKKITEQRNKKAVSKSIKAIENTCYNPSRLTGAIFTDSIWASKRFGRHKFFTWLWELANMAENQQVDLDLFQFFTKDEIYGRWKYENYDNYVNNGACPITRGLMPYRQADLLKNFILTADTCLASSNKNVTLRFGHDTGMFPFVSLLQLDEYGIRTADPDSAAEHWRNYRIAPMAANVQWVFYRRKGKPDLIKIMLNERECHIPVKSTTAPYYKWSDVRAFYMDILAKEPK